MEKLINEIVNYAIENKLINNMDRIYFLNKISAVYKLNEITQIDTEVRQIHLIVNDLFDQAVSLKLYNDLSYEKEIFEAYIMDLFLDKPSVINQDFNELYNISPKLATNWFYKISKDSYYIKEYAVSKNKQYSAIVNGLNIEVTINVSKPEKDPKSIMLAANDTSAYPKCPLCAENQGFIGTASKSARTNIRLIELELNNKEWLFQYSPYSYYNEHSILLSKNHEKMTIDENTIGNLLGFVKVFPHYFIGSNAELPIVGGSILGHLHYQTGSYKMPIEDARTLETIEIDGVEVEYLDWPLSTFRVKSKDEEKIISVSNKIISKWKMYQDVDNDIFNTIDDRKNTITPILRFKNERYECDLILRNCATSEVHPDGIYHVHKDYHSIKKENIGLIEAMGLAILPGRLVDELEDVKNHLSGSKTNLDVIEKHRYFIDKFVESGKEVDLLEEFLVEFFYEILTCCGVFYNKRVAAKRFIDELK